ncbi:NADH dehydrogenase [Rhizocola hellebori]|uniref:NADH dehydrogenase n=1 Tax=Rhizocola hellebori TaxID=1392758 RepID=A0A8J3QJV7_9ACTN|nr:NADH-quinone oxidoreductase subunit L [Rhizocola hellebori]GIH10476.1 NADH dehydrogenase [Rhizocola hellebori]
MTAGLSIGLVGAPLLLGLIGLLLPARNRPDAAALGIAGAALSAGVVALMLLQYTGPVESTRPWVAFGDFQVSLSSLVDMRALLTALAVTVVAVCVQVYSISYLKGDQRYAPYAAQISIFTAAMLTVVLSGDLILLLIGWEVMGACSYLLIAHDRSLPEAPRAAVKAFLVTRVGDVGFLLGIVLLAVKTGSFQISVVLDKVQTLDSTTVTVAALLLLAGVAGKSAQFPLHTWLPDAMAGPTPISALIHAATMVAAGVYVVARLFKLFEASPVALTVLGIMAAITLLLGALAATAADDVKRVLAWSTVSQLGYMMAALSMGAVDAAMFHLFTHAAFKALLFLCAGSLIHAVGSNLLSRMGGLRKGMPLTFVTMSIGLGALVGVPPLAGFFSKEAVVASLHDKPWLWMAALVGIALTAWYSTRLLLLAFFGPTPEGVHPHEPAFAMRMPLVLLAIPAAGLGLSAYVVRNDLVHLDGELVLPLGLTAAGLLVGWLMCRHHTDPVLRLGRFGPFVAGGFGLDTVQRWLVVVPVRAVAKAVRFFDVSGVDGAVMGLGGATRSAGSGLAAWHRAALPRAFAAVLGAAALLAIAGVTLSLVGLW